MMNKVTLALLIQLSSVGNAQSLRINGFVENVESGKVTLFRVIDPWTLNTFDTATLADHTFTWEGPWTDPKAMFIQVPGHKMRRIFLEPGSMHVNFFKDGTFAVKGSKHNDLLVEYNATVRKKKAKLDSINELPLTDVTEQLRESWTNDVNSYYSIHRNSYFGTWLAFNDLNDRTTTEELDSILVSFSDSLRQTYYLTRLKEQADKMRVLSPGYEAPPFTMTDSSGNEISTLGLREKYLLIDFWASWCGPCREDNRKLAEKYPSIRQELSILSVSVDTDKTKWTEAIREDHANWMHVSDLKGFQSPVIQLYQIRFVPTNFLLDKSGKIVAKNVNVDQIERLLQRVR